MAVGLAQEFEAAAAAAQDASALRQVFAAIAADSCPQSYNFHMHTVHSDGRLQPEQVIEQAIAIGLKGLAITDHHTVKGYHLAQLYLAQQPGDPSLPMLWTGMEITANLLADEVHILAYAFDPYHPALYPYSQGNTVRGELAAAERVIHSVHQAGGLAVLAHPVRYKRSPQELIAAAAEYGIDGVETYYAYNNPSPWIPSPKQTQDVQQLSAALGLLNTCGTDTHGLSLLQRL